MNGNQKNRVIQLEQKQLASDQKKDYCGCWCHDKTLGDYGVISDEKAERVADIMKSLKYKRADGTESNMHEAWLENYAKKPPCLCNH